MKKKIIGTAILLGIAFASVLFAGGNNKQKAGGNTTAARMYTIEVGGSTSVTPLMELLADEYQKNNSGIKINISGTGSGDGIVNAGVLYEIGMSSRDLTPAEQGRGLIEETIAIDGIAVIVNNSNPVSNLTLDQIKGIFTGTITDWSQVTGGAKKGNIAVVSREEGSGTRVAFEELAGFVGQLVQGATESTSTGAIKAGISQNPDAIGYISLGSVDNSVKTPSVDGTAATNANVINGSYKIARPFIVLTGSSAGPQAKAFLDWILTPAGQAIVGTSWIKIK
ncbi:MAG: phosphate ABC transporter substrate-binding protein [Treponema sp.]|nr:phosphate ABC transporter substrate-binding protein [Treponema sp.]